MRSPTFCLAIALSLPVALAQQSSLAQSVVRHAQTPPGLILKGATVKAGATTLYLSGQVAAPLTSSSAKPASERGIADFGDTKTQTISTLNKVNALLAEQGYAMSDIVKLTIYVVGDPALDGKMDFAGVNAGFSQFFGTTENPHTVARSTVQIAALAAPGYLVEVEATAAK